MILLGRVIGTDKATDEVEVILLGGSSIQAKAKMLRQSTGPLYGEGGSLPGVGETGVLLHAEAYGDFYIWLGSFSGPDSMWPLDDATLRHKVVTPDGIEVIDRGTSGMTIRTESGVVVAFGASDAADNKRTILKSGTVATPDEVSKTVPHRTVPMASGTKAKVQVPVTFANAALIIDKTDPSKQTMTDATPKKYVNVIVDTTGLTLEVKNDTDTKDCSIVMDFATGGIVLKAKTGATVLGGAGGTHKFLLNADFITAFNNHTHGSVAVDTPLTTPGTADALKTTVLKGE